MHHKQGTRKGRLYLRLMAIVIAISFRTSVHASGTVTNASLPNLLSALSSGGYVNLAFNGTIATSNTLVISTNTVLDATGFQVTISGASTTRVFSVSAGVTFSATNLTIMSGNAIGTAGTPGAHSGGTGGNGGDARGAAILNSGTNYLIGCTFLSNIVIGGMGGPGATNPLDNAGYGGLGGNAGNGLGAAICNLNSLYLSNCVFTGNRAGGGNGGVGGTGSSGPGSGGVGGLGEGAAVYNGSGAFASVFGCTFSNNVVQGGTNRPVGVAVASNTGLAGTIGPAAEGGAVCNLGTNVLINCNFASNTVVGGMGSIGGNNGWAGGVGGAGGGGYGACVFNAGLLTISNSTLAGGSAIGTLGSQGGTGGGFGPGLGGTGGTGAGGGLYNVPQGTVFVWNSTFSSNSVKGGKSGDGGPGGDNNGTQGATGGSGLGGAICNVGTNVLINLTLVGNTASGGMGGNGCTNGYKGGAGGTGGTASGGSLYNSGLSSITNCTFGGALLTGGPQGTNGNGPSGPYPLSGGGTGAVLGANIANIGGTVNLKDTILAHPVPASAANTSGPINNQGYNLSTDGTPSSTAHSLTNTDPKLGPLTTNGGPTLTMALLAGSPAIDAGDPAFVPPPTTDQRGQPRVSGARIDIGAYEVSGTPAITALSISSGGSSQLQLAGDPGWTYSVWASTNLANWSKLGSPTATTNLGHYTFTDSSPPSSGKRFYQVRSP